MHVEESLNMGDRNMIQVYLLQVRELRQQMEELVSAGRTVEAAAAPGWDKLALWQQEKICGCAQPGTRALCLGGQLLLQYGAHEELAWGRNREKCGEEVIRWQQLAFSQLLEGIPGPLPLQAAYGPKGKPYICQVSWHYNLSHSGDYVALAISDVPVGIDIQQMRPYRDSLVKRFFAEEEAAAYENLLPENISGRKRAEGQQGDSRAAFFYTLWCRKEAYGKLLGTGLTEDVLKRNLLEDIGAHLYEYGELPGYCVCVCGEKQ